MTEAIKETGMSESTIMQWRRDGLRSQLVMGKRWLPEADLFERLRRSLADNPRVKTRWRNKRAD